MRPYLPVVAMVLVGLGIIVAVAFDAKVVAIVLIGCLISMALSNALEDRS